MRRKVPSSSMLIAFESAARHESFTKAANELSLTQGAVCRQIGGLEDFLGVRLFRRVGRGVLLTDAGRTYCRQISDKLDAIERDTLSLMADQGRGATIELAVMPTFATCWLIPRLPAFFAANPDIRINLTTQTRPFLFDETAFDASLYYGIAGWPGTEAHFLMHEESVPVCSPRLLGKRKRLRPQDIAALPLLQQSTRPYAWRDWFDSLGVQFPGSMAGMRMELFTMLAKAAMQDMGVALIPPLLIEAELQSGQLVVALEHFATTDKGYYLIIPDQKSEEPALQAFRNWLQAEAARPR